MILCQALFPVVEVTENLKERKLNGGMKPGD